MKPIFIVGSPRTGTHWLRRILSEHESIVSNPYESHVFPLILGPFLYSRLPWNRSWETVNRNFNNSHLFHWIGEKEFNALQKEYRIKEGSDKYKASMLAKSILDNYYENHKNKKSRFLLEKSPNHIYYLDTIMSLYEDAKIIELTRHPIEVIKSLKTLMLKDESWVPKSLNRQIEIWIKAVKAGLQYQKKPYSHHIFSIKYENLINDFENTVNSISKFLDIGFNQNQLNELKNKFQRTGEGGNRNIAPLNIKEYRDIQKKTFSYCKELNYHFEF